MLNDWLLEEAIQTEIKHNTDNESATLFIV